MDFQTMMDGMFDDNLNTIYGWLMDILSVMNTFSTAIVLFMLLKKTPNEMKPYRWFLLNVALSAYALDIWVSFFTKPLLLPALPGDCHGLCMTGILRFFGAPGAIVAWLVYTELLGFFSTSLAFSMIYRYFSMKGMEEVLLCKRILCIKILIQLLYSVPFVFFFIDSFIIMKEAYGHMDPNDVAFFQLLEGKACLFTGFTQIMAGTYIGIIGCELILLSAIIFLTDRTLRKMRAIISNDTYKYQKQLILSLTLQFAIPAIFVAGCNLTNSTMLLFTSFKSTTLISRFTFAISTLHTTANAIMMLTTIGPYRRAMAEYLQKFVVFPFKSKIHPLFMNTSNNSA